MSRMVHPAMEVDIWARRDAAPRGLIKRVAATKTGKLHGAHILALEGADSLQTAALAINCGLTVEPNAETIFPYLTTVEGLKLAAQAPPRTKPSSRAVLVEPSCSIFSQDKEHLCPSAPHPEVSLIGW